MKVEYRSNNSGGSWWLKDEDWKALEQAGWKVEWVSEADPESIAAKFTRNGRYLGAIATTASYECETPQEALRSFELFTGQQVSDEGCNCCGAPHSFSWDDGYCSGEDCLKYLYPNKTPKTLREFYEN